MKAVNDIKGKMVEFEDGRSEEFDSIVFATGFRSTAQNWLKVSVYQSIQCTYLIDSHTCMEIFP